jgi:CRP-like cAMP-binding protein
MHELFERLMLLKRTPTFAEVPTDDLRVVAQELSGDEYFRDERVFHLGDPSDRMFVVVRGRVGISLEAEPRAGQFVSEVGPGGCFGEMGLFDDQPRSATAVVLEDATLLALDKHKLRGLVVAYPGLALGLLRGLSHRVRAANEMISGTKRP